MQDVTQEQLAVLDRSTLQSFSAGHQKSEQGSHDPLNTAVKLFCFVQLSFSERPFISDYKLGVCVGK